MIRRPRPSRTRTRALRLAWLGATALVLAGSPSVSSPAPISASASASGSIPVLVPASPPASPSPAESAALTPLTGRWHRVAVDEDDAMRLSAIDRALEDVSWLMRQMALRVLRKSTVPPPEMRFFWEEGQLYQKRRKATGVVEQRAVLPDGQTRLDDEGNEFSWHLDPEGLRLRWIHPQARGSTLFRIEPAAGEAADSKDLVVDYLLQVTAISDVDPVRFRVRFDRVEETDRDAR